VSAVCGAHPVEHADALLGVIRRELMMAQTEALAIALPMDVTISK
jgi:hypothetical protein